MFSNPDIDIDTLPKIDSSLFNHLDYKYKNVLVIKSIIFSIVLLAGYFTFYFLGSVKNSQVVHLLILLFLAIIVTSNIILTVLGFKKKLYKLRKHDLIYKSGILWTSETSVPFVRVQHSEVIQGPIERIFGLAKLKLYTAGGSTSDLSVPGLKPDTAEELKDFITKRIQEEEE